jgi:phosphoribosylformylglycinamidine synthase
MRAGIIVFPGSNCDHDMLRALGSVMGQDVEYVWHAETELKGYDLVVLPGGFSYGDYLRPGAIARFAGIMRAVARHAEAGGLMLGVCNGFQVLAEASLVPGALRRNASLKFLCRDVLLRVETDDTPFTRRYRKGDVIRVPIAHMDGNYYAPPGEMERLESEDRVVFRYCDPEGNVREDDPRWNPNGSMGAVAGVLSEGGNVLGMMPHPERVCEEVLGGADGVRLFESVVHDVAAGVSGP